MSSEAYMNYHEIEKYILTDGIIIHLEVGADSMLNVSAMTALESESAGQSIYFLSEN